MARASFQRTRQRLTAEWSGVDSIREMVRAAGYEPATDAHERTQELEAVKIKLREVDRDLRIARKRLARTVA